MIIALRKLRQVITLLKSFEKDGRFPKLEDLSIIENGSVVYDTITDKIIWSGKDSDLNIKFITETFGQIQKEIYLEEYILTPEIVDSHTHLVFAGNRAKEYALRLDGATYQEIASKGGGILNSAHLMRNLINSNITVDSQDGLEELFQNSVKKINEIHSYGIGTIEIKSGYGLDFQSEWQISLLIDKLKKYFTPKIQIFNTYLSAHAIPPEYQSSSDYMTKVTLPLLERLNPLKVIDAVDIFMEEGYFDELDVKKLFNLAQKFSIPVKLHADEFTNLNGAELGVSYNALSVDHLLATSQTGVSALSRSQTVATLLPGTSMFLGKKAANAKDFYESGCKVAFASDYNPGSSHCDNLILVGQMALPLYGISVYHFWISLCLNSAHALGKFDQGVIAEGFRPRFTLFKCLSHEEIPYSWGKNLSVPLDALLSN
jgi:imidazolonepropionase